MRVYLILYFCNSKLIVDQLLKFIDCKLENLENKKNLIDIFLSRKLELDILYLELDKFIRDSKLTIYDLAVLDLSFLETCKIYEAEHIFSKLKST